MSQETFNAIRGAVDALELAGISGVTYRAALYVHEIRDRKTLSRLVALMERPQHFQSNGHQWIRGDIGGQEVSCHYKGFAIGGKKSVRIVEVDDEPDLAALVREAKEAVEV